MHAEKTIVHERSERQAVEYLHTVPPHVDRAIFPKTIIVKTIHLTDLATLMIAAQKRDAVRVANLEAEEQQARLHTVIATIHVIAHKEVVYAGTVPTNTEKLAEIVELAVDVAANLDRQKRSGTTVTGDCTGRIFGSFRKRSFALSQSTFTSSSLINLHPRS